MVDVERNRRAAGKVPGLYAVRVRAEHEASEFSLSLLGGHDLLVAGPSLRLLEGWSRVRDPQVQVELVEARLVPAPRAFASASWRSSLSPHRHTCRSTRDSFTIL